MILDIEIIITSLTTVAITLGTIWLKEYIIPKRLSKHFNIDTVANYIELNKICRTIKETTKANGVYIAQFHNGGSYSNGVKMNKYTVVGEDYDASLKSYKQKYNAVHCNTLAYLINDLLVSNKHIIDDISTHLFSDRLYEDDLKERGIVSTHTYLIKEPYSKQPLGFISLEYTRPTTKSEYSDSEIWKKEADIAAMLNRKKPIA